jgi:hypothetical protein
LIYFDFCDFKSSPGNFEQAHIKPRMDDVCFNIICLLSYDEMKLNLFNSAIRVFIPTKIFWYPEFLCAKLVSDNGLSDGSFGNDIDDNISAATSAATAASAKVIWSRPVWFRCTPLRLVFSESEINICMLCI